MNTETYYEISGGDDNGASYEGVYDGNYATEAAARAAAAAWLTLLDGEELFPGASCHEVQLWRVTVTDDDGKAHAPLEEWSVGGCRVVAMNATELETAVTVRSGRMKNQSATNEIKAAVKTFMGSRRVCWATPGTEAHSSNFYGDEYACRFDRAGLLGLIAMALENWDEKDENDEPRKLTTEEAIDLILSDMQFERPTE